MAICKFYQEGNCRFGSSCRFEHPPGLGSQNGFNNNRFAALGNQSNSQEMNNGFRGGPFRGRQDARKTYDLDIEKIKADFQKERPIWPFSSYGPTQDQPRQLIEGDVEISPEEMRTRAYLLRLQGKPQDIADIEATANKKMSQVVSSIVNDTAAAIRYVQKGEEEHPNRWDVVTASTAGELEKLLSSNPSQSTLGQSPNAGTSTSSPFGQASTAAFAKPAFGQPSLSTSSPFGAAKSTTSPFGQVSNTTASPFAQANSNASPFGQTSKPTNPLFGQPSMGTSSPFGGVSNTTASPFGQPSSLGNNSSPFGKPSTLGGGGGGAAGFGQPSNLGQASPFGQPSALNNNASPFARATQTQASPFGQPSILNAPSGPATMSNNTSNSPFGQPPPSNITNSPFGQPSINNANNSPFAQNNNNNSSPFAVKTTSNANGFGSPSPFAQGQAKSPFAQANEANNSNQSSNPFGQNSASNSSPFGVPNPSNAGSNNVNNLFASSGRSPASRSTNLTANSKIFPTGVPTAALCEDPPAYRHGDNEAMIKDAYEKLRQTGSFVDGIMPMVAPKFEWVTF